MGTTPVPSGGHERLFLAAFRPRVRPLAQESLLFCQLLEFPKGEKVIPPSLLMGLAWTFSPGWAVS
jgi:hypothetical protein